MTRVLKSWTCHKSAKYLNIFKSHIQLQYLRFYIQPKIQVSSDNITKPDKFFFKEHKKYSDILKRKKLKLDERYVSDEAFEMLCSTFNMDHEKCQLVVHQKQFQLHSTSHIINTALFLKGLGVTTEHLIRAPWMLREKKEEMSTKLNLIKQPFLFKNELDGLGFIIFQPSLINAYNVKFASEQNEFKNYKNRIYYIADKLEILVDLLTLKLIHAWQVLHKRKENIDAVIKVLIDFKIEPMEIVNDAWVFCHSVDQLKDRLSKMKEAYPDHPVKLWFGRCSDSCFQRAFGRQDRNVSRRTLSQVLKKELDLKDDDLSRFMSIDWLCRIKPSTVEYKIQGLKKGGLDINFVKKYPHILIYNERKTLERLKLLEDKNISATPKRFALSEQKFQELLSKH